MNGVTMEKMLINATQPEELRVALIKDNLLFDLDIEKPSNIKKKANIYKGVVRRIEPSLEAAFVEYGAKRQGFLPLREISPEYYAASSDNDKRPDIKELLKSNQELMIQVDKEERGSKGAALTTYISLAGCYLVLMPNSPRSGGISRRIEGEERDELRGILRDLVLPEGMGTIIRTSGVGKQLAELQWDLDVLVNQWKTIKNAYDQQHGAFLIHQEGDVVTRSIRDNLRKSIDVIIIDDQETYVKARNYIEQVNPNFLNHVQLYNDAIPLFSHYQIEGQIETAYQRQVSLPSGGSIVIDHTEALVSIDINSAKATGATNVEATALMTNLEAANEIARQLRLRDLGGLIVIDFIDMTAARNQREIENQLREALKPDRARVQVGKISRFGLLEMSRQRIRLSLGETSHETCPRCDGQGTIRRIQSLIFAILRLIEEHALTENTQQIQIQLPVPIATYILNEKRKAILDIETRHGVSILILANPQFESPHYKIKCIRSEEQSSTASYKLIKDPKLVTISAAKPPARKEEPAIRTSAPPRPQKTGLLKRLFNRSATTKQPAAPEKQADSQTAVIDEEKKKPFRNPRRRRSNTGRKYSRPRNTHKSDQPPKER